MISEVLSGDRVRLRPPRPDDELALTELFSDPSVARWWGDPTGSLKEAYQPDEGTSPFVIEVDAECAGFVECYEEAEPMYKHAAIDIALHPRWQGKGIGPEAIVILARHLVAARGHHRLTIDPAVANTNAIKAYSRIGFRPVGVMRRYERSSDGEWHDGLLMDLLAEELPAQLPSRA
jgi:aminoglycoside 6'-N-acetyltransferase